MYSGPTVLSPAGAVCDPPLTSLGGGGGYACYSGTLVGAHAVHHCFNCDDRSVRTCTDDGTWSGTELQCSCMLLDRTIATYTITIASCSTLFCRSNSRIRNPRFDLVRCLRTSRSDIDPCSSHLSYRQHLHFKQEERDECRGCGSPE